jgi:hypothetical protein
VEGDVPFDVKECIIYMMYQAEVKGHCHMEQQAFLIALSGSFDVVLKMESLKK